MSLCLHCTNLAETITHTECLFWEWDKPSGPLSIPEDEIPNHAFRCDRCDRVVRYRHRKVKEGLFKRLIIWMLIPVACFFAGLVIKAWLESIKEKKVEE